MEDWSYTLYRSVLRLEPAMAHLGRGLVKVVLARTTLAQHFLQAWHFLAGSVVCTYTMEEVA